MFVRVGRACGCTKEVCLPILNNDIIKSLQMNYRKFSSVISVKRGSTEHNWLDYEAQ